MKQTDRDRLAARGIDRRQNALHRLRVHRLQLRAVGQHAFADLEGEGALHQRLRTLEEQVEGIDRLDRPMA